MRQGCLSKERKNGKEKDIEARKAAISPTTLGKAKPAKIKLNTILINAIITPGTAPKINIPTVIITSEKSNFKKPTPGIIGNSNFITTKAIHPINAYAIILANPVAFALDLLMTYFPSYKKGLLLQQQTFIK